MQIWRTPRLRAVTRIRLNAGLANWDSYVGNVVYADGTTHYDDLGDLFTYTDTTGTPRPVGRETIRRWHGNQPGATNRAVPAYLDGHRPFDMYVSTQNQLTEGYIKDGIGRRLSDDQITNARFRVYLCALLGRTPEGDPYRFCRASQWNGKPWVLRFRKAKCSDCLLTFDSLTQGIPCTPGGRNGPAAEASLVQYGWAEARIDFAYPGEEEPWELTIEGFARALVPGAPGAAYVPPVPGGVGGMAGGDPYGGTGAGGEGTGGSPGGSPGGAFGTPGQAEEYESIEDATDEDGFWDEWEGDGGTEDEGEEE